MPLDAETRAEFVDQVRRFVEQRLRPIEAKVAEDDAIPADVIGEMKALGLYGLSIPEEFGGLGCSMEDEVSVGFELGRCSPAFRSAFGTNVGIGSLVYDQFGAWALAGIAGAIVGSVWNYVASGWLTWTRR